MSTILKPPSSFKVELTNQKDFNIELANRVAVNAKICKGGYSEDEATVAAGKGLIAAAITQKGVLTMSTATFAQMASNIDKILVGYGGSEVYELSDIDTLTITNSISGSGEVNS